ncbi:MAG: hypothetical protein LUQ59_00885, partial [Methanothrix sp.]|nr:hypothetical protein [Methanothrix sp.]
ISPTALKYPLSHPLTGAEMFRDILTICWSIKEVNRNLSDRKSISDVSIKYLKNSCSNLAGLMREASKTMPNEVLLVEDNKGARKSFSLNEVAEMLYDARTIVELNLIDNISRWARAQLPSFEKVAPQDS